MPKARSSRLRSLRRLPLLLLLVAADPAGAEVARIEILDVAPFAGGHAFGEVGPYERVLGRLHYAVPPTAPANAAVVDLDRAPRNDEGEVTFAADFMLLKPVEAGAGNGTLLYEVNNRGGFLLLGLFNDAPFTDRPSTRADAGNGFLFEQGYTLVTSGWNWDIAEGGDGFRIDLPAAVGEDGEPITGEVTYEVVPTRPTRTTGFFGLRARGYPPAVPNDPEARLLVRDTPGGPAIELPRASWRLARLEGGDVVEDPTSLYLERGFEPGKIYQLVYTARDPKVVGLGMVAVRDALDFFARAAADRDGNPNPLAEAPPETVLISGFSQSGRLIQHMLLEGFHRTAGGEPAFDGALVLVAGGGKGGFNHRFAQTTRHFSQFEDLIYRSDFFPFATVPTMDPATGRTGSVFAEAREAGPVPKVVHVNTPLEYWTRSASLLHTDPQGERDVGTDANARIYVIAGAQHFVGRFPRRGEQELCNNPLDYRPVVRALLVALRDWVVDGDEPPPSRHPTIEGGTLVMVDAYRQRFPDIPGVRLPVSNLQPPRLDHGPRFEAEGIVDLNPPRLGAPFVALVPAPDADGLDTGGIVPPAIAAPVGTYTGWALRTGATGMPDTLMRWTGSFVPFARTRAEREAAGDPRPSLEERYGSPEAYAAAVEAAAERLVERRLLPAADVDGVVADAAGFHERVLQLDPSDPSCLYLDGP